MMRTGVRIVVDGVGTKVSAARYARVRMDLLSNGIGFREDRGPFHKWLIIEGDGLDEVLERGVVSNLFE